MRMLDVFLIAMVVLWTFVPCNPIHEICDAWAASSEPAEVRAAMISSSCAGLVVWSGLTSATLGFLSFFQSNLTRRKRIVLLVLCLLPAFFTAMAPLVGPAEDWRLSIQLGVLLSGPTWVVNGPGALTGLSLSEVLWRVMVRLRLASGDLPD